MKKTPQFVDLYYNDLHCLEESIKAMKKENNCLTTDWRLTNERYASYNYLHEVVLKYCLFFCSIQQFTKLWEEVVLNSEEDTITALKT
jgi:hypothetical protein